MVVILIIFGWIIINIFECVLLIDDGHTGIHIHKIVFVLYVTSILIILKYSISNGNKQCQLLITDPCMSPSAISHCPLSKPLASHQLAVRFLSPTPQQAFNNSLTQDCSEMCFSMIDLTVVYLFSVAYECLIDCLLQRLIIIIFNLIKIALEMILLMAKQVQYWWFDLCNVINVWNLWNCSGSDIIATYHQRGHIFNAIGNIYIIWIVLYAMHINFTQKVNTSSSGSYKLSDNEIIHYILNKTMAIIAMIIHYRTFTLNDNQCYQIINKNSNYGLILTVINVIGIIACQIEILAAFYVVIGEISSFMISHAVMDILMKFNLYLGEADSLLFHLITNRINLHSITCVFNSIDIIVARIDHIYIIFIMMDVINMISIRKLNANRNNGCTCKTRIIQFVLHGNKHIAIIVVRYQKFNVNVCIMDKFYSTTHKTNNFDTRIIVINTIDIIMHQIGHISHFTSDGFNDVCNSPGTVEYFIAINYNTFKLELAVSKMDTTNTLKTFKIFLFTIVIIMAARISMEIITIVLKWLLQRLFCSILDGMTHIVDILIKMTILLLFDALTNIVHGIISKLDK